MVHGRANDNSFCAVRIPGAAIVRLIVGYYFHAWRGEWYFFEIKDALELSLVRELQIADVE